jgi:AcrR family transcriptional regulator
MVERGRATRAALLEATSTVIARQGYGGANIRAIAAEAGVAVGTIFRHYPNKAALLAAAAAQESGPVLEALGDLPERAGTGTVLGNLTEVINTLALLQGVLVPFELAFLADPELAEQRRQLLDSDVELPGLPGLLADYLAAEQRSGRIRQDVDPHDAARVLLATLFGLFASPASGTPAVDVAVSLLVDGIKPRRRGPTDAVTGRRCR